MMLDWNEYRKQLAAGVKELGKLSPDMIRGYVELSSAGQKKNLLGAKTRELIALAAAVTLTLRRLHRGPYGSRDQEWCNQGRDCGDAWCRHHSLCWGSPGLLRACDGRVQGISARRFVVGMRRGVGSGRGVAN
jgi:hypothetical protein